MVSMLCMLFLAIMLDFRKVPLAKILFPFVLGIGLHDVLEVDLPVPLNQWALAWLMLWIVVLTVPFISKKRFLFGYFLALWLVLSGFLIGYLAPVKTEQHTEIKMNRMAILLQPFESNKNHFKALAQLVSPTFRPGTNILIYIQKDTAQILPEVGETIVFKSAVKAIDPPSNPEAFNYAIYLKRKGIYGQVFLKSRSWIKGPIPQGFNWRIPIMQQKQTLIKRLDSYALSEVSNGILKALLLGEKSDLSSDTRKAFANAGVMHVLAVSGLHVGILLLFIQLLFKPFEKQPRHKAYHILKNTIILSIIWLFAALTGFSPSISRAATMFTFLIFGQLLQRNYNAFNSLSAAAILLLCLNPNDLFNVGFQLSFSAVFGILFFYPLIRKIFYSRFYLIRKAWELSVVSVSAQLATFPLTLYYFHQFPLYFLLANLIVIPFVFLLMIGGFILLFAGFIINHPTIMISLIDHAILGLMKLISSINSIPFNVISHIDLSSLEMVISYIILLFFSVLMIKFRVKSLYGFLMASILLVGLRIHQKNKIKHQKMVTFYSIRNKLAVDFIRNDQHVLLVDTSLISRSDEVTYQTSNFWIKKGLKALDSSDYIADKQDTLLPNFRWLKKGRHVLFDHFLLCINHSSHIDHELTHTFRQIHWLKQQPHLPEGLKAHNDIILFNYSILQDSTDFADTTTALVRQHSILKQGSITLK